MNIIFGDDVAELAREKYTVLELDTFLLDGKDQPATAYAVVEHIPLQEMESVNQFKSLHENLLIEYQKRNWNYCKHAIEQLQGRWHGELDTFYTELHDRIQALETQLLPDGWNGVIVKSS